MKIKTKTVLGSVIGSKNLDRSWAPRSKPPDTPAVRVTDLPGGTTVAVAAPLPAPTDPAKPATPATTPDPTKPTEPTKPEPTKPDGAEAERKAQRLLKLGKSYLASNVRSLALKKLQECLDKYPDTDAAKEAKKILADF